MLRMIVAIVLFTTLLLVPAEPLGAQELTWTWTGGPAGAIVMSFITTPLGTLLVGTEGGGLYRSADGGASWTEPDLSSLWPCCNYNVSALAAGASRIYLGTWGRGVCRSFDDGETWEAAGEIPEGYPIVSALAVCRFGDRVYAGGNYGVYRSDDGGSSWAASNTGLPSGAWVKSLALRGPVLYAMMNEGVYRLDPGTQVWEEWNYGLPATTGQQMLCTTTDDLFLATHAGGPHHLDCADSSWTALSDGISTNVDVVIEADQTLYAGIMGGGVFRWDSASWYWNAVNDGLWNGDVRQMTHRGLTPYAGTYGAGVFELDPATDMWTRRADAMNSPFVTSIVTDGTNVYAGTFGAGIYRSDDQGDTWTLSIDGLGQVFVHCMATDAGGIYAGTWTGVYKSTDQGVSWTPSGLETHGIFSMRVDGSVLYAGAYEGVVWASDDGGANWVEVGSGLPSEMVFGIARLGGVTYAALNGQGVYRLPDGDTTWIEMNDGLPELSSTSLAVSGGELYLGLDSAGVRKWNAGTETWDATAMSSTSVLCLTDLGSRLLAGSWGSLYATDDGGATWVEEYNGLKPWLAVRAIAQGPGNLFASLSGAGVWRAATALAVPEPDPVPALGLSLRVEPNPFAPSARVAFTLDRAQPVSVAVYDPAGRLVTTLASGLLPAGPHERVWNGADDRGVRAAAGVYMIRLQAGGRAITSKLVLVP